MPRIATSPERATYRTVILLRRSEKMKLDEIASREKLSAAEVIRRFIQDGETFFANKQEEETIEAALNLITTAVSESNASMKRTIAKLDRLHAELAKRDIR